MSDVTVPVQAAWWLPGPHLQTIWAGLGRPRRLIPFAREVLPTDDGDELILDHVPGQPGTPRVLVLHGLEGSAHSLHAHGLASLVTRLGWRATLLNFRSCARDPEDLRRRLCNKRPRLYHSGVSDDLDLVVRILMAREPQVSIYAVGFSLGGNVLLKWLGEQGASSALRAASTISVPYDLAAAARFLERPIGRIYAQHFLSRLKPKALELVTRFPADTVHLDPNQIRKARTFAEFDAAVTAPLHGFGSAAAYYAEAGAISHLPAIRTPTLCISSVDDPFFPEEALARSRAAAAAAVRFAVTSWGGHAGFVAGPSPWRAIYWAEEEAISWLARHEPQHADGARSPPRTTPEWPV